ncbi:MAG: helix-turn-helix domain-containing protein [Paraburkholderia sp.]|uniref:excisionase family DNA-binding protein n=1 Tax=Paraburkholderia sp. TaxID=1926495 RepID=UPI0011FA330F|nr:excisionase family DNA-binding protein [Paraburkholderia sp.]TAM02178.1 MAG: helix-turn-helix domain-containing protein [Paraburkholderia sp.]TAM28134.1 MAG: helix-turn-helix domain-containing protein [Paraburkholderia sp.]
MADQGEDLRTIAARLKRDSEELSRRIGTDRPATAAQSPINEQLTDEQILLIAKQAVDLFEKKPLRPPHVTIKQAAERLGLSRSTVSKMLHAGQFRLNKCGRIPIEQIDAALLPD